jgi:acetyl esterase/lipase
MVRANADAWGLDTHRIGIMGFSAGGHIAASAATLFTDGQANSSDPVEKVSSRPDAAVLMYPVITMKRPFTHEGSRENLLGKNPSEDLVNQLSLETRVTAQTPPTFLCSASDDPVVPIENSLGYIAACRKYKVPVEVHFYADGPHGFGMGGRNEVLTQWPKSCALWLKSLKFTNTP